MSSDNKSIEAKSEDFNNVLKDDKSLPTNDIIEMHEQIETLQCENEININRLHILELEDKKGGRNY